jgi:hypothetical protein
MNFPEPGRPAEPHAHVLREWPLKLSVISAALYAVRKIVDRNTDLVFDHGRTLATLASKSERSCRWYLHVGARLRNLRGRAVP